MRGWSNAALKKCASPDVGIPKAEPRRRAQRGEEDAAGVQLRREMEMRLQRRFYGIWNTLLRERYDLEAPTTLRLDPEFQFHPTVEWRIDFALPAQQIMIEIDGGTWSEERSGHNWGTGITNDHTKQNAAVAAGWKPFRLSADMLEEQHIRPILDFAEACPVALQSIALSSAGESVLLGAWGNDDRPTRTYYALGDLILLASWVELPPVEQWGTSQHTLQCAHGYGWIPSAIKHRAKSGRRLLAVVYA